MNTSRTQRPLLAIALVALAGVAALELLWLAIDTQVADPPSADLVVSETPPRALATPVLSVRRTPATLAVGASAAQLRARLGPLMQTVGDQSCVQIAIDGRTVLTDGTKGGVIPGSNVKLTVAAAALEVLGAGHTFTTKVTGTLGAGGAVTGDLALVGGGDPLLATAGYPTSTKYPQQPATSLDALADAVVAAGVRSVSGGIVADESRYDTERFAPQIGSALRKIEVGPLSALMVNDGFMAVGADTPVDDPALGAAQLFNQLLKARGVTIRANSRVAPAAAGAASVASTQSAPLGKIVGEMLTNSDNNTAELLVKELGVVAGGAGTREAGLRVVQQALTKLGVPLAGVTLEDGSGLGGGNRLTCAAIVDLLNRYGLGDPIPLGMAVAGTTGTLREEFGGSPVKGVLRGKTGTLTNVKALSGYLPVAGGSVITFSLLLNGPGADSKFYYPTVWQAQLAAALATYPAGPTADQLAPLPLG